MAFFSGFAANAQCHYISTTTAPQDTLTWTFYGGTSASYGCSPIDPTYWISGYGDSVLVTFVHPQSHPSFRVWGMNTDDSATVYVNGAAYHLDSISASYDAKDTCGQSPGPDGIGFSSGNLVGVLTPLQGNYSYQNVMINAVNVSSIAVKGLSGAGWGFAGVSINCPFATGINDVSHEQQVIIYPNPFTSSVSIEFSSALTKADLKMYDVCGQLIRVINNISGNKIILERGDLQNGIYFIRISQNNQTIMTNKLIATDL